MSEIKTCTLTVVGTKDDDGLSTKTDLHGWSSPKDLVRMLASAVDTVAKDTNMDSRTILMAVATVLDEGRPIH